MENNNDQNTSKAQIGQLLYEQTGLKIRKNNKNQFVVVTLHYTADPERRSQEWKDEAMAGMPEAKWLQEQEIDYGAMFGQKVFPQFTTNRQNIIVKAADFKIPSHIPLFGGFDFGIRNPTSFHVYGTWDGVTYALWEHYEPCRNLEDLCHTMKTCPYWERIKYVFADPHLFDHRGFNNKTGQSESVGEQMRRQYGIRKLVASSNDEAQWMAIMLKHWADPNDPTFKILDCCPAMIAEFDGAFYAKMTEKQQLVKSFKEKMVDVNNHALDDCKYYMLSGISYQPKSFKSPTMVQKWIS